MTTTIDMTKEIDKGRGVDSFLVWAVLALISDGKKDLFEQVFGGGKTPPGGHHILNVDLKFNGVDVDFQVLLDRIEEARNWQIKNEARELLDEKCRVLDVLHDTLEDVKRKIRRDLDLGEEERW